MSSSAISTWIHHQFPYQEWFQKATDRWNFFKSNYFNGRVVTQLTYYTLIGGTIIGGISIIAAWILDQLSVMVGSFIIALSNGVGAYVIRRLQLEKELEDTTISLTKNIQIFNQSIKSEAQQVERLNPEITNLKTSLNNYKKDVTDSQLQSKKSLDEMNQLVDKIKQVKADTGKLNTMYAPMNEAISNFVKFSNDFLHANQQHQVAIKKLMDNHQAEQLVSNTLKSERENLKNGIQAIQNVSEQTLAIFNLFDQQIKESQKNYENISKNNTVFAQQLKGLQDNLNKLEQQLNEARNRKNDYQAIVDKLNKRQFAENSTEILKTKLTKVNAQNEKLKADLIKKKGETQANTILGIIERSLKLISE